MRKLMLTLAVLVLASPRWTAAQTSDTTDVIRITHFDSTLHVSLDSARRLPNGVYVLERIVGTGPLVNSDDALTLRFASWLANGRPLPTLSEPERYRLRSGLLLPSIEAGIPGMRIGGTRRLLLSPSLAYGAEGGSLVPANSVVVVDVTVVSQP
jgi:FKBP-type peptidyl-prolyl cis-trans isomerase